MSATTLGDDDDDDAEMVSMRAAIAKLEQEERKLLRKEDLRKKLMKKKTQVAKLRDRQYTSLWSQTNKTAKLQKPGLSELSIILNMFQDYLKPKHQSYQYDSSNLYRKEQTFIDEVITDRSKEDRRTPLFITILDKRFEQREDAGQKYSLSGGGDIETPQPNENSAEGYVAPVEPGTTTHAQSDMPLTRDQILTYLEKNDRSSKRVKEFLHYLCSEVESKFSNASRVWVGYNESDRNVPIFVAIVQHSENVGNEFYSFKLIQRLANDVSSEAKDISESETKESLTFSDKQSKDLRACTTNHSTKLMKEHSNLLLISASKIKSKDGGRNRSKVPCVVLYVHVKGVIPFGEEPFPTKLDEFPVDVREAIFDTFSDPLVYQERLKIGCRLVNAYSRSGSIGGYVHLPNGKAGILTVWHMFQTPESETDYHKDMLNHRCFKREVYQPYPSAAVDYKFGHVVDGKHENGNEKNIGVDAALIEITSEHREPHNGNFFSSDEYHRTPTSFNSGTVIKSFHEVESIRDCICMKHGPESGCTIGNVKFLGGAVKTVSPSDLPGEMWQLHQQIEIKPDPGKVFSAKGDSGSLVLMVIGSGKNKELRALGMVVGGTSYQTVLVTPIWAILESFGLPLQMYPFDNASSLSQFKEEIRNAHTKIDSKLDSMSMKLCTHSLILEELTTTIKSMKSQMS